MADCFYSATVSEFLAQDADQVFGKIAQAASSVDGAQGPAWVDQIEILKAALSRVDGESRIYFEFSVPRLGKRIDVLLLTAHVILVLEFKNGTAEYTRSAVDQVWDYALDLKNFHTTSHPAAIVPILIATDASVATLSLHHAPDLVYVPMLTGRERLHEAIDLVLSSVNGPRLNIESWETGAYRPTPTIIEAASALYARHGVAEISRRGAEERNLSATTDAILGIVEQARRSGQKAICFVTGVPGAGKTLVGLNVATRLPADDESHAVYLSGNGPLVKVLTEALARDEVARKNGSVKKGDARRLVGKFIQSVHHYRDAYLKNADAPFERVTIFDEAQRAWNFEQTSHFMRQRRSLPNFPFSEPEFLISCTERHKGWSVVVCLVGGGQEINKGEVGIAEWLKATLAVPGRWQIYVSPELKQAPYSVEINAGQASHVTYVPNLHLNVSMRSFKANKISHLVDALLSFERDTARKLLQFSLPEYPIYLTRSIERAKRWLKKQARGNERPGLLVSSSALRLKPCALDVRAPIDPVHWFLAPREDVRSSYYLEDAATEFQVQGLELDWAGIVWDGDLRYSQTGSWQHMNFKGSRWERVNKAERQRYLENSYRVLLTRARQGMVIVVPEGDAQDPTRSPAYYDGTFDYLKSVGLPVLRDGAES